MIQDRVRAGLERAKNQGKQLSRPNVQPQVEEAIRVARVEGKGILKIARELGVGVSVVQRMVAE
ncbi:MAG: hypothetical protein U5S82_07395 [Gammaproteobacteria bacterium]|nr:hypothetical protein [Gammaproteobacteria bacterium]